MLYGYARCSTNESKQNVEYQRKQLRSKGVKTENIYCEYESGTKVNRIELSRLFDKVQPGDTIIVTEVSRITRSTKQLCDIIEQCKVKHIKLEICGSSLSIDCTGEDLDPMTKAFLQIAGVFAELEKGMIQRRVRSGLDNARAKGVRLGRPPITLDDVPQSVISKYELYSNGDISKVEYARLCGVSRPTLDKYLAIIKG